MVSANETLRQIMTRGLHIHMRAKLLRQLTTEMLKRNKLLTEIKQFNSTETNSTQNRAWHTYFLCISAVCHRLVFIILQCDMLQIVIWYIFNDVPSHRKASGPFIQTLEVHVLVKIYRSNHLSHAIEVPTTIDLIINTIANSIVELCAQRIFNK